MQKSDIYWRGDIYSANMALAALELSGETMNRDKVFLDFGCSSGSLIRVIKAVYPESSCIGVDPVYSSIQWAAENLPGISFDVSPIAPPLNIASGSIDVVSAISIWSHFSPSAAIDWINEVHRILAKGGTFVVTIHGLYTLLWHCQNRNCSPELIDAIHRSMCSQGYNFQAMDIEPGLPPNPDWGNMYMTIEWLVDHIQEHWDVLLYQPGRSQYNQDLLVLKSK
jgi:cyclopropane fatty-acyl-phospholipid synthase-like methyltransferase